MRVGKLEDGLNRRVIAAMKDGSYVVIPTQFVIDYSQPYNRDKSMGVGVCSEELVRQLQEFGNVRIARDLNHKRKYSVLKAQDIVEIYTTQIDNDNLSHGFLRRIVPPKKGLRRLLWRLSMV